MFQQRVAKVLLYNMLVKHLFFINICQLFVFSDCSLPFQHVKASLFLIRRELFAKCLSQMLPNILN